MINKMREMAPLIMLIILVAFVGGTIFLDWGMNMSSRTSSHANYAGKVNGKEIPLSYFDRLVNMERQKLEQNSQGSTNQYQSRMVPSQVWEQEVNRILTREAFKKLGLGASADEVFEYIKRNPLPGIDTASVFQTNGTFDTSKYARFLNNPQNYDTYPWLHEIETYTQDVAIPTQKLQMLLAAAAMPSRSEVAYQYEQQKDRGIFEYVKVSGTAFRVDPGTVTDAMIKRYYETHQDTFYQDQPQADLYYVKFPKLATAQDEKTYFAELTDLKGKIKSTAQFMETAKTESDDETTAPNGGDLGWFAKGAMVPAFDSVAFSIDTGKISNPIRTPFGLHLILVEKREMQKGILKVKARHILRKIGPTPETLDKIAEQADSLRVRMMDKGFVVAAKEDHSVQFDSTGYFRKGDPIPAVGFVSGVSQFAFNSEQSEISERMENTDGFYLFTVKKTIKKGTEPLEVARPKIVKVLADSLRIAQAKEYAEKLALTIQESTPLAHFQKPDSMKVASGVTDTITQNDYVAGIGYGSKVAAVAFALPVGKLSKLIQQGDNFYIVRTLWKKPVEKIEWNSPDIMQVEETMKNQVGQRSYMEWYTSYKNSAKIISRVKDLYVD